MIRKTFLGAAGGAVAAAGLMRAAWGAESDIALKTSSGTIFGTLSLPAKTPAPVVLIIAGSGATDRNGNNGTMLQTNAYKLLADALAARGIASVRYDKRGIAGSQGAVTSEADLRFDTYIDDAAAWVSMLAADPRFTKVVVAGHSEGSLLGIVASQRGKVAAFVSLEGAGRPAYTVLREQLKPQVPAALYAQADAALAQLQAGKLVPNPPAELAQLFRPSVQPYLISWFKYDPAVEIGKLTIPATVVQGTADVQITMEDANALHKGYPPSKLVVIDGMNHVLKDAPDTSSQAAIMKGYTDPALPLDPKAVNAVVAAAG